MEILDSARMADADRYAISTLGIPSIVLMENAASSAVEVFAEVFTDVTTVAVIAGGGNNAGDGFAIARHLLNNNFDVDVLLAVPPEKLEGDAKVNYDILVRYKARITRLDTQWPEHLFHFDAIVDALFGTGLSRPLEGSFAELVAMINSSGAKVLSVDIPSGLSGDTGNLIGPCVDADVTVTFCRPKMPHALYPAKSYCGQVVVTEISIPDDAVEQTEPYLHLVDDEILPSLAPRMKNTHKGHYGHAVIIGGSTGKAGAPVMTGLACMRTGAGLTTCIAPTSIRHAVEGAAMEMMTGFFGTDIFGETDAKSVAAFCENKTVAAVGPGLGTDTATGAFLSKFIISTNIPLILDADALNLLTSPALTALRSRAILTPHIGEFARMLKMPTDEVMSDRVSLVRTYAEQHGVVVVLKSADTLIALPDGNVYISDEGTPALAKGGSGDVLTGIITALVAQGAQLGEAAVLGCHILGTAGKSAGHGIAEETVLARDVIEHIGKGIRDDHHHHHQHP